MKYEKAIELTKHLTETTEQLKSSINWNIDYHKERANDENEQSNKEYNIKNIAYYTLINAIIENAINDFFNDKTLLDLDDLANTIIKAVEI